MSFNKSTVTRTLSVAGGKYRYFSLPALEKSGRARLERLPFSIRVLLESALRNHDNYQVTDADIDTIAGWTPDGGGGSREIAFKPGRVILQDFTGVPCVVDLAAMRAQMKRLGGDVSRINPQVPCDLVIDHSLQVDVAGSRGAFARNVALEFRRNRERYAFLKWGQGAFRNFRVVPPATGIIHQVNLEFLASGVLKGRDGKHAVLFPDSLVGTDSHTTMINGLGVVGWGVGGIEAEAVMLGEPLSLVLPRVVGVRLTGALRPGVMAADAVLAITQLLRRQGVVDAFVEFFGPGLRTLTLADRATIANMCPEYGATVGLFPVDVETLTYYRLTGRGRAARLVEAYFKAQGLFDPYARREPEFSALLVLDLGSIEPCLAGPKRPQDRVLVRDLRQDFLAALTAPAGHKGFGLPAGAEADVPAAGSGVLGHGSVVLAAITSCTNTSNPSVLVGAGLLARNALARGLKVTPYVKTSFTPGSQAVDEYLKRAGLMGPLEQLGFHNVGYGCATCIGNSGPLAESVVSAIGKNNLVAASVTSGNRNFEGRINPHVKANYLGSPMLVVAYALAGTVNIDLTVDPLGHDAKGQPVFLRDIWPSSEEIAKAVKKYVTTAVFTRRYRGALEGNKNWADVRSSGGDLYAWKPDSTYIQQPPYFQDMSQGGRTIADITRARVLVLAGDSITTDHISPAGDIAPDSPAGRYLRGLGVSPEDFNSYGSRRGNDRVMRRGTFANIRFRNLLAPGKEGSWTKHFPDGALMSIVDAADAYARDGVPLIVIAGKEYGTGSSRDWAAKGPALLGVRAVIAESFERIHRSNLAGMGILPLQFRPGETPATLGLTGAETYDIRGLDAGLKPGQTLQVTARGPAGEKSFRVVARLDTPVEIDYYRNGGILPTVLGKLAR